MTYTLDELEDIAEKARGWRPPKKELTAEQILDGLRFAVETRGGNYTYPGYDPGRERGYITEYAVGAVCQYSTPDGYPACIVGYALDHIDPRLRPPYGVRASIRTVLRWMGVTDDKVKEIAGVAQIVQDNGYTWKEALDAAERANNDQPR